jgi:methyltransferase (TIGR00027 family)
VQGERLLWSKENLSSAYKKQEWERAAHQLLDDPKVFDDPVALRIIGKESASKLQADLHHVEAMPLSPYLRAFVAARSRYAEDELAAIVRRGVRQYVILGAGLDTFAYRNPYPEGVLHVFEVDHPTTQTWKRARLEEIGIALPGDLTFALVDFETQTLAEGLHSAGYDPGKRTFFSWLGVTEYLTTETVMAALRFIASAPGTGDGVARGSGPGWTHPAAAHPHDYSLRHPGPHPHGHRAGGGLGIERSHGDCDHWRALGIHLLNLNIHTHALRHL